MLRGREMNERLREQKWIAGLLLALLLLSAALVWHDLGVREVLGRDENVTIVKMDQPDLKAMLDATRITFIGQQSNTQPFYFLLQYLFWPLVGRSSFMLRFLPSVLALLAVPMTYKLGETLFSREAGLIGALLTALLPLQVRYAQLARPYSLLVLLSLASALALFRALKTDRPTYWIGFVLVATLNFYTHYNALFVLLAEGIVAGGVWLATLFSVWRKQQYPRRLVAPLISFLAIGILCLPGLVRLVNLPWVGVQDQAQATGQIIVELTKPFFRGFMHRIGLTTAWPQALIVVFMGLGLAATLCRRRWQTAALTALWICLPFVVLAVMKSPRPFADRYVIFIPTLAFLLAGQGMVISARLLAGLGRRWHMDRGWWAVAAVLALSLVLPLLKPLSTHYAANRAEDRLDQTLQVVERQARAGDAVVASPRSFLRPLALDGAEAIYLTQHLSPAELDDLALDYQRLWILYTSYLPPAELQEPLDQWVQAHPQEFVRVPIKAVSAIAFGTMIEADAETALQDRIDVLADLAQNSEGEYDTRQRYSLLADACQSLGDLYDEQSKPDLAAEFWKKAEEARATAVTP
jgi:hypothetical protein